MKKITKNILKYLGYSFFSLVTFLLFVYITFPMGAIQNRLDAEIAKATDGKVTLKAKKLSLAGISGLRLTDINIFIEGENGAPATRLTMDEFEAKIHLFGTIGRAISKKKDGLLGTLAGVDVKLKQGDGSAFITISEEEGFTAVLANIEQMRAERILPAFVKLPFPVRSMISAKLEANLKKQWYSNGQGKCTISLRNTSIGEGTVSTPLGPFELPIIDLGTISADLKLEKGALKIENWKQAGNDLAASDISGKITLQKRFDASALDLRFSFKPSDNFLEKNGKFNSMLQLAGLKKDNKENYTFSLAGRVSSPKVKGSSMLGL